MATSFADIAVGSTWSRPSLATHWGYLGFEALARGVVTPKGDNKIILFVTEEKQPSSTSYQDLLNEDILSWEGPNHHQPDERIVNATQNNDEIHLFHRKRHHRDFEYRGRLKLLTADIEKTQPSRFTFEVLDQVQGDWSSDQILGAIYLYLQLGPTEIQSENSSVMELASGTGKSPPVVAAKLRAFARLDPLINSKHPTVVANLSPLDYSIWRQFEDDWTNTLLAAATVFNSLTRLNHQPAQLSSHYLQEDQTEFNPGRNQKSFVDVRLDQYRFRKMILESYGNRCCISGIAHQKLIVASHIVPWAEDEKNRLNPRNGLCLSALHDRAFDQGLITVTLFYQRLQQHGHCK